MDEYFEQLLEIIEEHGQACQGVFPTEDSPGPSFTYTIGNARHNLPEFIFVGFPSRDVVSYVINPLGELQRKNGAAFEPGLVSLGGRYPVKLVETTPELVWKEYPMMTSNVLGITDYRVQQIILCDPNGVWPGEPGCSEPYAQQPNLAAKPN